MSAEIELVIAMPDWLDAELLIVFAMAAAGVWAMIAEARAHRRDADERIELHARIAELAGADPAALRERLAELTEIVACLRERTATLEARIDHRPITQTRAKDGKFTKTQDPT